ncbi:DUF3592 domain-containing protein [Streptomyces alboflavus]|uniref:DUF3592 domain-containing protein n=1 Tax=Streptomyces alboflavus TaxID=67267 RepID=UPI0036AE5713
MGIQEILGWWWVVPGGIALVGYACSLGGVTRVQRGLWVVGTVVGVHPPGHGESKRGGVGVTVVFWDPVGEREVRVRHVGERGDVVDVAWVGRELAVWFPRGRTERFRVLEETAGETRGLGGPNCLVFLTFVGLVVQAFFVWGHGVGLLGVGGLLGAVGLISPDVALARKRAALLADAVAVPGRVVSVSRDVYTDGEGGEVVNHAPVVQFATREGVVVTALCRDGIVRPRSSRGRHVVVHYAPGDPTVFTPDLDHDRRERAAAVRFIRGVFCAGGAAVAAGVISLLYPGVWAFLS